MGIINTILCYVVVPVVWTANNYFPVFFVMGIVFITVNCYKQPPEKPPENIYMMFENEKEGIIKAACLPYRRGEVLCKKLSCTKVPDVSEVEFIYNFRYPNPKYNIFCYHRKLQEAFEPYLNHKFTSSLYSTFKLTPAEQTAHQYNTYDPLTFYKKWKVHEEWKTAQAAKSDTQSVLEPYFSLDFSGIDDLSNVSTPEEAAVILLSFC